MTMQNPIIIYNSEEGDWFPDADIHTPHVVSALIDTVFDKDTLKDAMNRAVQVCLHIHVPVWKHFQRVYVPDVSGSVHEDWALSDFAFYLLLLNGNAENVDVAYAQAYVIHRAFCK